MNNKQGILYIVATPIGNLEDITIRAINTLKEVDIILAEDTRTTKNLLKRYEIKPKLLKSYRDQVHNQALPVIQNALSQGLNIALVSDAGTPTISDPGFKLVRDLRKNGFQIVAIPGPSAIITALSASGLPTDKFVFLGFLPKSPKKQVELLNQYSSLNLSIIVYESPYRIKKLIKNIFDNIGDCEITIARELTKVYEEITTTTIRNLVDNIDTIKEKGEYTIILHKI